jgi:hypothetical protein
MPMADGEQRGRGGADDASAWMQLGLAPVVGRLVDGDARGVLVEVPGQVAPVPARSLVAIDRAAIADRREVLLVFEQGRVDRPIVLGLLQDPTAVPDVARVDGRRVVLEGKDEIELRCGAASITLRRNGRIVIRGVDVETRAKGRNRIRGGSVAIN